MLRPHLADAVEEIERHVRMRSLEAGRPLDGEYAQVVHEVIRETVAFFVDSLGQEDPDVGELAALYARLGAEAARRGRGVDRLQTALRLSSQVACRRFIKDAYRFGWPKETLSHLTDHLFELLARAADAGAQGYARQQGHMASDRERRRARLRDLLVREPASAPEAIAEQARSAEWKLPATLAVVALRPGGSPLKPNGGTARSRILPPDVLADWDAPTPYLIVPDPDSPGGDWLPTLLRRLGPAAIGPTVPPARTATSLRWARHTIALVERGILDADRPARAADHTALLAGALTEDLIDTTASASLAPLLALPARRRTPLLVTLLTYLQCGDNAVLTGDRLHIHEQTVRYRLRRITELTGHPTHDPAHRLDLMLTLTWLIHAEGRSGAREAQAKQG
ncbi:PucR family transcriptional regulator [Streptomyces phyllanthi]|uniref:PucR family transcriptional regulator n=1 Tax=Streptomyces phyllanthi TaxID=1803180 RepID=A0A5N8W412_9ACTN|nr:PucR family transcriptional regulator [Streptomyces phyllanthi]MPY41626.1 PucR family transcriptional regulator [Streptomyces phyllanthi]